jgi:hypothetical protein
MVRIGGASEDMDGALGVMETIGKVAFLQDVTPVRKIGSGNPA